MENPNGSSLIEQAIVDNLEEVLDQLRAGGISRARFGSIELVFGAEVEVRPQPVPTEIVIARAKEEKPADPRLAGRPGYANLFNQGAPSFTVTPKQPKQ